MKILITGLQAIVEYFLPTESFVLLPDFNLMTETSEKFLKNLFSIQKYLSVNLHYENSNTSIAGNAGYG